MKFRQVALRVSDLERATNFYAKIFGASPIARFDEPGFVFFDLDGVRLLLDVNAPKSGIYLEVTDVRRKVEELRIEGVKIVNEPHIVFPDANGLFGPPGNEWLAFIEDSEGNLVGLMSREVL